MNHRATLLRYSRHLPAGSGSAASMTGLYFATLAGHCRPCSQFLLQQLMVHFDG